MKRIVTLGNASRAARARPRTFPQVASFKFLNPAPSPCCASKTFATSITARNDKSDDMAPKGGFELKTPKGTRDWDGKHMVLREQIFDTSKRSRPVALRSTVTVLDYLQSGSLGIELGSYTSGQS